MAGLAEIIRGLDTTGVVFTGLEIDVRMAGAARAAGRIAVGQIGFGSNGAGLTVSRGFVDCGAVGMALGAIPEIIGVFYPGEVMAALVSPPPFA